MIPAGETAENLSWSDPRRRGAEVEKRRDLSCVEGKARTDLIEPPRKGDGDAGVQA